MVKKLLKFIVDRFQNKVNIWKRIFFINFWSDVDFTFEEFSPRLSLIASVNNIKPGETKHKQAASTRAA